MEEQKYITVIFKDGDKELKSFKTFSYSNKHALIAATGKLFECSNFIGDLSKLTIEFKEV